MHELLADWFGREATFKLDGQPRAKPTGAFCREYGPEFNDDPAALVDAMERFRYVCDGDGTWPYVTPHNVGVRFAKWREAKRRVRA